MTIYSYRIVAVGAGTALTGTLDFTSAGTAVAGHTSAFTTELAIGSVIITPAGHVYAATTLTSNTALVLQSAAVATETGVACTHLNLSNLEALGLYAPKSSFMPWVESKDLGNGLSRGLGRPSATWAWGFTRWQTTSASTHRDVLRTYCTGKSARVYIRTRKNDNADAYVTYSAVMLWPDGSEERQASRRLNLSIQFRDLVAL